MYMFNKHVHAMKMLIHRRLNAKKYYHVHVCAKF